MERRNLCGFSVPRIHGWKGRKKILFARADPAQWSANGLSKRRAQITRFALSRSLNQGYISTIYAWSKIANFRFFYYIFSPSSSPPSSSCLDRSTRKWLDAPARNRTWQHPTFAKKINSIGIGPSPLPLITGQIRRKTMVRFEANVSRRIHDRREARRVKFLSYPKHLDPTSNVFMANDGS